MRTFVVSSAAIALILLAAALHPQSSVSAAQASAPQSRPVPVFRTVEMMIAFFEPLYGDLTRAIAKEPADRDAWRSVLSTVQKIAELHNLLFFRTHEEYTQKPEWPRQIAANRARFLSLAEAARSQDYALTRTRYEAATLGCNACHKEFRPVPVLLKPYDPVIVR